MTRDETGAPLTVYGVARPDQICSQSSIFFEIDLRLRLNAAMTDGDPLRPRSVRRGVQGEDPVG